MVSGLILLLVARQASATTNEVPFRTLAFGTNREIKDGGAVVMRTDAALGAYRVKMKTTTSKAPAVDWTKEHVVAIHAKGNLYGSDSLQIVKVRRMPDASLEVDAALDRGDMPATPTPGVVPIPRKEGLYVLIAVPPFKGEVRLRVVDPPARSGDRNGSVGSP